MSLHWWRSMLPQGLREILLCTLTHAYKAAVNYLPLSLVNTRFICVPYSALGAFVKGFTRFYCLLGGHRIPRPGGRSVLSRCSDSVGSVGISHAVRLLPDSDLNRLGVFFFLLLFLEFCQWCFYLTLSFSATSGCTPHIRLWGSLRSDSHLKREDLSYLFRSMFPF